MKITTWLEHLAVDAMPTIDECVEQLGPHIDYLNRFKDTPQDHKWHAEGDVHIHTGMVLDELYLLLSNQASHIQGWQRQALILGVILHDIAKPIRTREVDIQGKIRIAAPQHEDIGRSYLAFKLHHLELSFEVVWTVLNLVGEHHMPKRLAIKNMSVSDYWRLARQVNTELVYWLEVADMRGRTCPDLAQQLLYLEEFKLFAEDYGVWGKPLDVRSKLAPELNQLSPHIQDYVYAHALYQLENGKITQPEEALGTTYQHREDHPHVVVMCAPSGSGKSTWINQNYPDYELVSLDVLREEFNGDRSIQKNIGQILQAAKELLRVSLRKKQGVVWDATNLRSDFRALIIDLARDYHALVTLVVMLQPEKTIYKNNLARQYSVPDSVLDKQFDDYQLPALNEAHQYWVVGEKGKTLFRNGYYRESGDGFC
ncbi:AAA family ATPase [Leucothrix arctica]|uniref:HD domain-containing protein n=1 Tax=Leucothrix arctica TaxID=1481894 RepID=A0A317CDM7_9GAMM|nr:AAA family ATPase [Leucothrix arctica]PWQ96754.1 hypothetical protein DKT75_08260 [Leucothrix arctica]